MNDYVKRKKKIIKNLYENPFEDERKNDELRWLDAIYPELIHIFILYIQQPKKFIHLLLFT